MRAEPVEDLADPRLADYRAARDPGELTRRGVLVAEGAVVVRRLLAADRVRVLSVLGTPAALARLGDVLEPARATVYVASRETIARVVGYPFHRGALAVGERGASPSLDAFLHARLLVALERVSGPDNVGAVFRNAAAFGADAVLLSPGCADPLYRRAIRASAGATLAVPFVCLTDWPAALARLRAAGFTLIALSPAADALDLAAVAETLPAAARRVVLLGAEADGLGADTLGAADLAARIPMAPGADSLNVAAASAIALHRLAPDPVSAGRVASGRRGG